MPRMRTKTSLMNGYGIAMTTPGLFDQVIDRDGKPAKLQVLRPGQVAKLARDRRKAGQLWANYVGQPLNAPLSPDEYRRRFGK